jgi:hypothetical protein
MFQHEDLGKVLQECGFAIERNYSDAAGTPFSSQSSEFAVIAKKI